MEQGEANKLEPGDVFFCCLGSRLGRNLTVYEAKYLKRNTSKFPFTAEKVKVRYQFYDNTISEYERNTWIKCYCLDMYSDFDSCFKEAHRRLLQEYIWEDEAAERNMEAYKEKLKDIKEYQVEIQKEKERIRKLSK